MDIGGDLGVRLIEVFYSCISISVGRFIRSRRCSSLLYAYDIVDLGFVGALAAVKLVPRNILIGREDRSVRWNRDHENWLNEQVSSSGGIVGSRKL